ncbi:epidermal growth factor receptor kinase substrate 8-like protein 3b [Chanos chanos]|uniref:Epidermal growth factor receptor kinase substrate 8-like protein 3b n=1 Tax=Chanos chanos TaxID=29144 RepID=A0A6J2WB17_CHACN|nr:epidermal growth factor receptor kinase substrate 8-like protein 3 [Chanos chanos]
MFQSNGFSHQHRGFSPEAMTPNSGMSRPNSKSIYKQRKEYSDSLNRRSDNFQYRVEHLLTCELDGRNLNNVSDCVARLKQLDSKGKVWGQEMILEVIGDYLQLCDIETKEMLESLPLGTIKDSKAVLDSCAYNSLLVVTVHDRYRKGPPHVFMFQCEEIGAEEIKDDLNRVAEQRGGDYPGEAPRDMPVDIRSNLENIVGQKFPGNFPKAAIVPIQPAPAPPDHPPPRWNSPQGFDDRMSPPPSLYGSDTYDRQYSPEPPSYDSHHPPEMLQAAEDERAKEIFNHVVDDVELFMRKVAKSLPQENKKGKKKKKKDKSADRKSANLPPLEEYVSCLQKIKYGFNLMGKLRGEMGNTAEIIHGLFISLNFLVSHYPPDIPPTVTTPLLTEPALLLLSQLVTQEENELWKRLGDAWQIPRSKWPNSEMVPPYIPVFSDGWQAPPPIQSQFEPLNQQQLSRRNSMHYSTLMQPPPEQQQLNRRNSQHYPPMQLPPEQDMRPWNSPPQRSREPPLSMRVIYDFMARSNQELSVLKGEVVQVVDKSGHWWKVRNSQGAEGHVPPSVLEPMDTDMPRGRSSAPTLTGRSTREDVRAWLQYKGFSNSTLRSLGVMDGAMLLRMSRDEMRAICPEEGGRVFFQLQAVKSALALASEVGYNQYNGR